jgi:hypothetical protein
MEKRHITSHVVHVDNLDARLHLGYANHAIVHAKAASLRARLVFINLSSLQKRTESGLMETSIWRNSFGMMVAREGVEPPTPAFSAVVSSTLNALQAAEDCRGTS